jgi:hypothetical protein
MARGQTGNRANRGLFGGAIMALCSGRTKRSRLLFPAPFLWFFLWTNKERTRKPLGKQKPRNHAMHGDELGKAK